MKIELDDKALIRKRQYLEDQKALERWAKNSFTSGYSTSNFMQVTEDDVDEELIDE